jgi:hypothetical protein
MNRLALVILAMVCIMAKTNAQNWKDGVVVLANGDSIKGKLSVEAIDSYECKMSDAGNITDYKPEDVTSFYIPREIYLEPAPVMERGNLQTVFVKVIVSGKMKLMERKGYYFIRDSNNNVFALEEIKQNREVDGREYQVIVQKYKQILQERLIDCPEAQQAVKSTMLTKKSLIWLFNKYNACFRIQSVTESVKVTGKPKLYIGIGYNFLSTRLHNEPAGTTGSSSTFDDKTTQSSPGFFLQFNPAKVRGLSIQLSGYKASYAYHNEAEGFYFADNSTSTGSVPVYYKFEDDVSYKSFVLPLMIQYSLRNRRIVQPYVGLGVAFHFTSNYYGMEHFYDITHNTDNLHKFDGDFFAGHETALRAQLGLNFKLGPALIGGSVTTELLNSPLVFSLFTANQNNLVFNLSAAFNLVR